jgi:hypothetical protein
VLIVASCAVQAMKLLAGCLALLLALTLAAGQHTTTGNNTTSNSTDAKVSKQPD